MPRIAIKDYDTSFFHIMVQGIRKEYIFETNDEKKVYQELMYKYLKKFNVKIISYCIMSNHAHMLIYIEDKNELSKYMKAINTTYAMFYNKKHKNVGYVFRNRYKAEPIYSEKYLINCIYYIHDNPVKAQICNKMEDYKYSSYREYIYNDGDIINVSKEKFREINKIFINSIEPVNKIDYSYIDYEEDIEYKEKEIIIEKYLKNNNIQKSKIKENKNHLKKIANELRKECGMTHKEIADELGVSRVKITRLISEK